MCPAEIFVSQQMVQSIDRALVEMIYSNNVMLISSKGCLRLAEGHWRKFTAMKNFWILHSTMAISCRAMLPRKIHAQNLRSAGSRASLKELWTPKKWSRSFVTSLARLSASSKTKWVSSVSGLCRMSDMKVKQSASSRGKGNLSGFCWNNCSCKNCQISLEACNINHSHVLKAHACTVPKLLLT